MTRKATCCRSRRFQSSARRDRLRGAETHIRVAPNGTHSRAARGHCFPAFSAPALIPARQGRIRNAAQRRGTAVSRDAGKQWEFVKPGGATWVAQDSSIYVDPASGRLFFYALAANPAPQAAIVRCPIRSRAIRRHLLSSKDEGVTWNVAGIIGFNNSENPRFTSAPPQPASPRRSRAKTSRTGAATYAVHLRRAHLLPEHGRRRELAADFDHAHARCAAPSECGSSGEDLATYDRPLSGRRR